MLLINKNKIDGKIREDGVTMKNLFDKNTNFIEGVTIGHAVFPPGTIVPSASHNEDEYSYVISGTIKCKIGDQIFLVEEGSATFIPAGEEHSTINDSDSNVEVIWMLIEKK